MMDGVTAEARVAWRAVVWVALLAAIGCQKTPYSEVSKALARVRGRVAVSVNDATGGNSWDIRGDEPFAAGDSIAMFVLATLFGEVEAGRADLDERVPLADGARPLRLGALGSIKDMSLRDLAVLMLADRDAAATNALIDRLGLECVNQNAKMLGATRTTIERKVGCASPPENYTTAKDLAGVWAVLAKGGSFSAKVRASLAEVLRVSRGPRHAGAVGLPAADIRTSYDGDSPGRATIVHGSGVLCLPGRNVSVAVVGEGLPSDYAGEEIIAKVSGIVQTHYEEECRHVGH